MLSRLSKGLAVMVVIVSFLSPSFVLAAPTDDVVAVAASMHECINELATQFENHGLGTSPKIVSGASGKLASQIIAGAPFGLFLSASPEWTKKLESEGLLYEVFPMATSPVVAWWPKDETITLETIERKDVRIAIADPEAAPFGKAAAEYLNAIGIYDELLKEKRLVIMGNVEQAALAAKTGGADIGMFSLSVAKKLNEGSYVILPVDPLENSGGLVKSKATKNIEAFWHYIRSEASYDIWIKWGFEPVR